MRASRMLLVVALVVLVASPILAAEGKRKQKAEPKPRPCPVAMQIEKATEGLTLTDDQKAKLEEIKKECGPKAAEAVKKAESVLTEEQKKARAEAMKAARQAGKSKEETTKAVEEAVKLSDDQKKQIADAKAEMQAVNKGVREKIMGVLTPEQKAEIRKAQKAKGKK